jgi:hypothetical protein
MEKSDTVKYITLNSSLPEAVALPQKMIRELPIDKVRNAQVRGRWRAVVSAVMTLRVP